MLNAVDPLLVAPRPLPLPPPAAGLYPVPVPADGVLVAEYTYPAAPEGEINSLKSSVVPLVPLAPDFVDAKSKPCSIPRASKFISPVSNVCG